MTTNAQDAAAVLEARAVLHRFWECGAGCLSTVRKAARTVLLATEGRAGGEPVATGWESVCRAVPDVIREMREWLMHAERDDGAQTLANADFTVREWERTLTGALCADAGIVPDAEDHSSARDYLTNRNRNHG
jgi:hypothetical protein